MQIIAGTPQIKLFTAELTVSIVCNIKNPLFLNRNKILLSKVKKIKNRCDL